VSLCLCIELKESFILIDQNNLGFIQAEDVGRALRALGQNPTDEDVNKLLKNVNFGGIHEIIDVLYILMRAH